MLSRVKRTIENSVEPITRIIYKLHIKPNHLTILACVLSIITGYLIASGKIVCGVILLSITGLLDMLDGALAKNHGMTTRFGEFLDSVCDRFTDGAILIGIGILSGEWILASIAIVIGALVSYTKAKGEKILGVDYSVGIMERSERLIVILIGLLFNYIREALIIVIVFSFITIIQRILYVKKRI